MGRALFRAVGVLTRFHPWFAAALITSISATALAQDLSVSTHDKPVPSEVAAPLAASLRPGGLRAQMGEVTADFGWVATVLDGPPAPGASGPWQKVPEGALVGAMRVSASMRDIRGRTINPGVYTLRFGVQPANGDHLGVSPFREFLLVSPAADDTTIAPVGHDGAVDLSRRAIGSSHPAVLSIDPPQARASPGTVRTNELGHKTVVVEGPSAGGTPLRFGLTLVGKIEA